MPDPKRLLKVFLCHASADKPKVRELYRYLLRRRIKPWFDEMDLVAGQDWQVEIPKALATSDAIIICLTKNSVDKEGYIQKEIKFALDKALEMPEGRIFLIPVRFEECEVPFSLSRYQWVDLFDEAGYGRMMRALKFRASQLERTTVEMPKPPVVIEEEKIPFEKNEQESIEKAVRDEAERESAEKAAREKAESEKAEREALEKSVREKTERDAAEKAAREKAEHEASEEAAREKAERERVEREQRLAEEDSRRDKMEREKNAAQPGPAALKNAIESQKSKPSQKRITTIVVGSIVLIGTVLVAWIVMPLLGNLIAPEPTATLTPTVTLPSTSTQTSTPTSLPVTSTFTPTLTEIPFIACDKDHTANAEYVGDVTVPDNSEMNPGQIFLKTWKIRNSGSCSWGEGYQIVFTFGDKMSGQPQALLGVVAPGQEVEISVQFTAPTNKGEYTSAWQMENSQGISFGNAFYVIIIVK